MPINIFWFRRDLRLEDNAALYHALRADAPVLPIFIFDTEILQNLDDKKDRRVALIHFYLLEIKKKLLEMGSDIKILFGKPEQVFEKILLEYDLNAVYCNHDYEPYAESRDKKIKDILEKKGVKFISTKDQCIFEKNEILKDDGKPYTIFTPYSKKWKQKLNPFYLKSYPSEKYFAHFLPCPTKFSTPSLADIGFEHDPTFVLPSAQISDKIIKNYTENRDFPAINGTSRLSVHLRFGTISIRKLAQKAHELNETFLNELIWRDFYMMILWHFPHVVNGAFKKQYDEIQWRNNESEFAAWCEGKTGYPLVDAGMRELNATGFMHNRVRMVVASFLTKHLLIDWRWGEAYFAEKLLDFDLAANNGGWQWAAGSGCDAAPYFRVFNPKLQTEKFDKNLAYIRLWIPELGDFSYPTPIVAHEFARVRVLDAYKKALGNQD